MTEPVRIGDATLYLGDKRKRRGPDHPLYRGGKSHDANGYVTHTSGPHAGKREHRTVMEGALGRSLLFADGASYPVIFRALYSALTTALLVWDKGQIGMGREFRKSHELILHGWQPETPVFADGVGRADVIKVPPVPSEARVHPAEKPVALITELLRVSGATTLDPFMGSASTGVACAQLGRKFIGIEIERRYFDIACERIDNAYRQQRMFA